MRPQPASRHARITGGLLFVCCLLSWTPGHAEEDIILRATTALRTAGPDAAQALLDAHPIQDPSASERAIRETLKGHVALENGDSPGAVEAWEKALKLAPTYPTHLRMWIARVLLDTDKRHKALTHLERVRTQPESIHQAEADVLRARVLSEMKRPAEARIAMRRVLQTHPEHPDHGTHLLLLARAEEALGQEVIAASLYRDLVSHSNTSDVAEPAAAALQNLEKEGHRARPRTTREAMAHAAWLTDGRRWNEALQILAELRTDMLAKPPPRTQLDAVEDTIAAVLLRADLLEEAVSSYRERVHTRPSSERLRGLGIALERMGNFTEARESHLARLKHARKPHLVYQDLLALALEAGDLDGAKKVLPRTRLPARRILWLEAWIAYRSGAHEEALEKFTRFAHQVDWVRGEYWRGRTLIAAGHRAAGLAVYEGIVARSPMGYYGAQAMNRLYDAGVVVQAFKALPVREWPSIASETARIHWPESGRLGTTSFHAEGHPLDILRELVRKTRGRMPEAERALALFRLGSPDDARRELLKAQGMLRSLRRGTSPRNVASRVPATLLDNRRKAERRGPWGAPLERDPTLLSGHSRRIAKRLKQMARLGGDVDRLLDLALAHLGDWHGVSRQARKEASASRGDSDDERALWRLGAPLAHREAVEAEAESGEFPPEILWALMRVESGFHPRAVSISNARGLLQILPRTARVIALKRGNESFTLEDLFEPEVNIRQSAWYVHELLEKFHGQELLAACSYNAGPHHVGRWLANRKGMKMDEFIEEIPSHQARRYTKTTLANLQRLRHAYRGIQAIHVSNRLRSESRNNIAF